MADKPTHLLYDCKPQYIILSVPDSGIQIYPNCMLIQQKNHTQKLSFSCIETSEGMKSQNNLDQISVQESILHKKSQKICVPFNNSNFAFFADETANTIQIHNLSPQEQEVKGKTFITEIKFLGADQFLMVYALLQKKICEMGFEQKFIIKESLGKGATADVFLVERKTDKKLFAAKIISIKQSTEKAYETFVNESKLLRVVNHKNIIRLESLYVHKKQLIQVMEYLNGGHLLTLLRNNTLKLHAQRWKVLHDLLEGLEHLRQKRIIHRDLKLENILIRLKNGKREYVISDFGLAIWAGENHPVFHKCGTPGYIAPQTLSSESKIIPFTHVCDIFSLGVIAHLVFLHRPLFPYTGDIKQLLRLNRKAKFSLKSEIYNNLTSNQYSFLQYTLAKNPEHRPNSRFLLFNFFEDRKIDIGDQNLRQISSSSKNKNLMYGPEMGVKIKTEKQASIKRKTFSLDLGRTKKKSAELSKQKSYEKQRPSSATRFVAQIFESLISSSKGGKNGLKVKQNSVEKHKQMRDFMD